jgi:CelD/BcsL family acetyltransferase involved in cellulose biosynthesis
LIQKAAQTTEVVRPSALAGSDIAAWHAMMDGFLERAFYAPEYALACERAHGRARVTVFRESGVPVAFFPFQYGEDWHRLTGAAVHIGGGLTDHAGLIARPGFRISPQALLKSAGLGAMYVTHLVEGQGAFGLTGEDWETGHVIDLYAGSDAYLKTMAESRNDFLQDTQRRVRRAQKDFGPLDFRFDLEPAVDQARDAIAEKRRQYERTGVGDIFGGPEAMKVIEALFETRSPTCRPVVSVLRAGDRVLARHVGLMCRGVLSYWFPVYDPDAKAVSPGRLLLWHTIKAAGDLGIVLIDRGEGDNRAKQDFSTGTQKFGKVLWQSGGPMSLPARLQFSLLWRFQKRNRPGSRD